VKDGIRIMIAVTPGQHREIHVRAEKEGCSVTNLIRKKLGWPEIVRGERADLMDVRSLDFPTVNNAGRPMYVEVPEGHPVLTALDRLCGVGRHPWHRVVKDSRGVLHLVPIREWRRLRDHQDNERRLAGGGSAD
jgi:hypothetical protein